MNGKGEVMRYPEFLQPGGRIGFIAPSFGAVMEPYHTLFENALKGFQSQGYHTVLGPNCYADDGIGKSSTPENCGAEINDFFTNDRCDVIISCGGGETMCEDLPFVDFEAIAAARPKWYMGYSDNTNLTALLPTLCDTAAIYGPCAASFGMNPWHSSIHDAFDLLKGEKSSFHNYDKWERTDPEGDDPLAPYNTTEPFAMKISVPEGTSGGKVQFSGRLIGGCLDCLAVQCGTRFDRVSAFAQKYAEDGIIWFIESCELTPMSVRRVLWQLDNAGWFQHVKGFLIGRPMMIDADGMGLDRFTAVTGILSKYHVPILLDVDLGHLPPMMPIIAGAMADVAAGNNALSITYRLV